MNSFQDNFPHFVGEVPNHIEHNCAKYVTIFCQEIPDYEFTNPGQYIDKEFIVKVDDKDVNVIMRWYFPNLSKAKDKIVELTPIKSSWNSCSCKDIINKFQIQIEEISIIRRKAEEATQMCDQLKQEVKELKNMIKLLTNGHSSNTTIEYVVSYIL